MRITDLSGIRWRLEAELVTDGTPAATAQQSGVFVSLEKGKPIRVPSRLLAAFEAAAARDR
jgi:acyl-CoA thioesterase FadM